MRTGLGKMIRSARDARELTREQLAKKLKISESYVGHLESGSPVYLSEDLLKRIRGTLGLRNGNLVQLARRQNARARQYYGAYRKKNAA